MSLVFNDPKIGPFLAPPMSTPYFIPTESCPYRSIIVVSAGQTMQALANQMNGPVLIHISPPAALLCWEPRDWKFWGTFHQSLKWLKIEICTINWFFKLPWFSGQWLRFMIRILLIIAFCHVSNSFMICNVRICRDWSRYSQKGSCTSRDADPKWCRVWRKTAFDSTAMLSYWLKW